MKNMSTVVDVLRRFYTGVCTTGCLTFLQRTLYKGKIYLEESVPKLGKGSCVVLSYVYVGSPFHLEP
jgi:hypothetical protein